MRITHLTASTFYGGPERQMLGLAEALPPHVGSRFLSFAEGGRSAEFVGVLRDHSYTARTLTHDTPHLRAAVREVAAELRESSADVLLCHGYKSNILGRLAARRVGIPAVAVSRGWTWEGRKMRVYTQLDKWHLRLMDHVVSVSEGQAAKVRACRVPSIRTTTIRNSARLAAFTEPDAAYCAKLHGQFPPSAGVTRVVVAAGRLSPEKGFGVLIDAAARVCATDPGVGFVLFGEGDERAALENIVAARGLAGRFQLPGFTADLDRYLPWANVVVLSSFTEGLPNVLLEASAAGVPVVGTGVGGVPEVIADGETGYVVPPGDAAALAARMTQLLSDGDLRRAMGDAGRQRMQTQFTFAAQADAYLGLVERLVRPRSLAHARAG